VETRLAVRADAELRHGRLVVARNGTI